jgi:alpha-L-arabinofuranosidase
VKYFGVGNESWGCGGNMRPEYYADLYRRYNTFVKDYQAQNPIFRIACGANGADYNWTEVLMSRVPSRMMNGLSLHYYTVPTGQWDSKGSSTDFGERLWFETLRQTMMMDEIIAIHSSIMDRSDPDKRVGLIIDEWGTWYDPLPGTNPGFLEQQNSLRDALVAGLNLHIFHRHADRVAMTNIAQTVNVLQAMILTEGPKMVLTPTYWVFEMFKVHQGGQVLPLELKSDRYSFGENEIPALSASATHDPDSREVHLSLINLNPNAAVEVSCNFDEDAYSKVTGRILRADEMNTINTFENPENIKPKPFLDARLFKKELKLTLPQKSVVVLELR